MNSTSDFLSILSERADGNESGILTIVRGKQRRLFCMRAGKIIFVASNVLEEQLTAQLVEDGSLETATAEKLLVEARRQSVQATSLLRETGTWNENTLRAAMARWIVRMARDTVSWSGAAITWQRGTPDLKCEITIPVEPIDLFRAVSADDSSSLQKIRSRLSPLNRRFSRNPASHSNQSTQRFDETERYLLAVADGSLSAEQAVRQSSKDEELTWRAFQTLVLSGWIVFEKPVKGDSSDELGSFDIPRTEEALDAWLERTATEDYYGVLQLERHSTRERIRARYYAIAREMHPDRFRAMGHHHLVDRVETCFSRITESYNTLEDPSRRVEYDREQAELSSQKQQKPEDSTSVAEQNYQHGKALADRKRFQEALTFLKNAVELSPDNPVFLLAYAEVLVRNPRERTEAEKQLLRAFKINPTNPQPLIVLGRLYHRSGHEKPAVTVLEEALKWDPTSVEAAQLLSEIGDVTAPRFSQDRYRAVYS